MEVLVALCEPRVFAAGVNIVLGLDTTVVSNKNFEVSDPTDKTLLGSAISLHYSSDVLNVQLLEFTNGRDALHQCIFW